MSKKSNKYQKFSKANNEIESEEFESYPPVKRRGHGDQKKADRQAKQLRQDIEFLSILSEVHHAA